MANKMKKIEKTEEFIAKWQEQTCLWDVTDISYRDRNKKAKAYRELSDFFEMTGNRFSW